MKYSNCYLMNVHSASVLKNFPSVAKKYTYTNIAFLAQKCTLSQ